MKETLLNILKEHPTVYSTLLAALLAAVFAFFTLKHNIKSSRVKNSLDFEATYKHNDKVVKSTLEIKKILRNRLTVPVESWGLEENALTDEANHLSTVMNEWERCANAIYHKIYDDNYLYGIYGSTVIFLFTHLNPYIVQRQKHNPRVYTKFCWLAVRWMIRRDSENKKKIDKALLDAREKLSIYIDTLK
ncbi:DUF4760 domain-containing protein [Vibrio cholerae]|uniref:DUF4760 domain-containing protein n=1 Tax=Vibrio cholerae TaxID=666 RepID=UPI000F402E90|nr:DUF4760 domain-containing protein [Vibrio cholerae]EGQ8314608.1 DUF4760 domain-containing protein [Vibrio cholerae]EGR0413030.1 DUF4760 domain-containing protein [Vibrio cholerae]EHC9835174.1 DUF4760 domain-containing protein [Vibrio cholerae]EIA4706713.1 DUF4760 domain-containing protein [Vibrio cholerae]EIC9802763.1 DUF4760 domain-containing protein [Vibrio cholerae]